MNASRVQVLQSHRTPLPAAWYRPCTDSVRAWALLRGYAYRWIGDELFDPLPAALIEKTRDQRAITADLGRLYALQAAFDSGFDVAVWVDADVYVHAPHRLELPCAGHAFGREVWVQTQDAADQRHGSAGNQRVYSKIHNAFMLFRAADPLLGFYRHAAERILERHSGGLVPQLIGPKLLATLHNLLDFPVIETAGVLSPEVARDIVEGRGPALELMLRHSPQPPAAVNLCGSLVARGELDDALLAAVVARLAREPDVLNRCEPGNCASVDVPGAIGEGLHPQM